jgi:hypothetical protein
MPGAEFKIIGLRELQRALKATSEQAPKAIQSAHKAVAEIVAVAARRNTDSAELQSRIKTFGTTRAAGIRFSGHKPKGSSSSTDALLQEFGGRAPLFGDRNHWFTVKQPEKSGYIVYSAIASTPDEVEDRYLKELDKAIRQHWS